MEFRPWPRSYHLKSSVEANPEYQFNDAYYFGVRIVQNDKCEMIRIDLTDTVKIFYNKLAEWINKDEKLADLISEKEVDIKVKYFRRE